MKVRLSQPTSLRLCGACRGFLRAGALTASSHPAPRAADGRAGCRKCSRAERCGFGEEARPASLVELLRVEWCSHLVLGSGSCLTLHLGVSRSMREYKYKFYPLKRCESQKTRDLSAARPCLPLPVTFQITVLRCN